MSNPRFLTKWQGRTTAAIARLLGLVGRAGPDVLHRKSGSPSGHPLVTTEQVGAVRTIRITRGSRMNAIDLDTAKALRREFAKARWDARRGNVRAVVFFVTSSGGDVKFAVEANPEHPEVSFGVLLKELNAAIRHIRRLPVVVGVADGPTVGVAMSLFMATDLRLVSDDPGTYLRLATVRHGISLPGGASSLLPAIVGRGRAAYIMYTDPSISAETASKFGLAESVAKHEVADRAMQIAQRMAATMPMSVVVGTKRLVDESTSKTLSEALEDDRSAVVRAVASREGAEALRAFLEHRQPTY